MPTVIMFNITPWSVEAIGFRLALYKFRLRYIYYMSWFAVSVFRRQSTCLLVVRPQLESHSSAHGRQSQLND